MALSAAEKQRRYRQRRDADQDKRNQYLQKEKEKYKLDKASGKKKLVKGLSKREHRAIKRHWREYKRLQKKKMQDVQNMICITPPHSPEILNDQNVPNTRQKHQGSLVKNRNRSKVHRQITVLENLLRKERKKAEMYRKRLERCSNDKTNKTPTCTISKQDDTPRSKTRKLLSDFTKQSMKVVKKTLDFHHTLITELKYSKKNASISSIAAGGILRKYKFRKRLRREIGLYSAMRIPKQHGSMATREYVAVRSFFTRDDVSRIAPGKNCTVSKNKDKRQKRLLTDSIRNLHQKYKSETQSSLSLTTFYRLKPFWVVRPKESDRDTCLCKLCENVRYTKASLQGLKVIPKGNVEFLLQQIVCNTNSKACMYNNCNKCKGNTFRITDQVNDTVKWRYWKTCNKIIKQNDLEKKITVVVKDNVVGTVGDLADIFHQDLIRYKKHVFNIKHQFNHLKQLRDNLKETEALVLVDFSENYICKTSSEIQAMHFGASKPQVSLHTGIYYVGQKQGKSFATVSDCTDHGPAAVWAHIQHIFQDINSAYPNVETLHVFSDGPVTQYRQKGNFFLFASELFQNGFKFGYWNFHEAGHGKGIPDGIGAVVKRIADSCVRQGVDIMNAEQFIEHVEGKTKVHLYLVKHETIDVYKAKLEKQKLKTVPGTTKLHQVVVDVNKYGMIQYSDVSCNCVSGSNCCKDNTRSEFTFLAEQEQAKAQFKMTNCKNQTEHVDTSFVCIQNGKETKSGQTTNIESETAYQLSLRQKYPNNEIKFNEHLKTLQICATFEALKNKCKQLQLSNIAGTQRYILRDCLEVDHNAIDDLPETIPGEMYPVVVKSDGTCLPSCGSVFAFCNPSYTSEMRVRIIHELCLNEETYLSQEFLEMGLTEHQKQKPTFKDIAKSMAFYSNVYVPGVFLNESIITEIYRKEILSICTPNSYMGMWQLHALASVLKSPIFSTYPNKGNPLVREHLHRLVCPRDNNTSCDCLYIMWTSTREDMTLTHWIPNHFVPIIPIEEKIKSDGGKKVESGDVSGEKVDSNGVSGEKVEGGDVSGENVDSNGVGGEKVESYDVGEEKVDSNGVGGEKVESYVVGGEKEDSNGVGGEKVESNGVGGEKVESYGVGGKKVESYGVGRKKVESYGVGEEKVESNGVGGEKVESYGVGGKKVESNGVGGEKVESYGVGEEKLESNGVDEEKVESNGVGGKKVESNGVGGKKVESNGVGGKKVESNAEGGNKVESNGEGGEKIESNGVGGKKVESNGVGGKNVESNGVGGKNVESNGVGGKKVESNGVGVKKVESYGVGGDKIDNGSVSGEMESNDVCGVKMESDCVYGEKIGSNGEENVESDDAGGEDIELDEGRELSNLFGKYVMVKYDGRPYPGKVIDTSPNDILVSCMHQLGKKVRNCFYWPGIGVPDVCWYELHNVLAVIPELEKLSGRNKHFKVNDKVWDYCNQKL